MSCKLVKPLIVVSLAWLPLLPSVVLAKQQTASGQSAPLSAEEASNLYRETVGRLQGKLSLEAFVRIKADLDRVLASADPPREAFPRYRNLRSSTGDYAGVIELYEKELKRFPADSTLADDYGSWIIEHQFGGEKLPGLADRLSRDPAKQALFRTYAAAMAGDFPGLKRALATVRTSNPTTFRRLRDRPRAAREAGPTLPAAAPDGLASAHRFPSDKNWRACYVEDMQARLQNPAWLAPDFAQSVNLVGKAFPQYAREEVVKELGQRFLTRFTEWKSSQRLLSASTLIEADPLIKTHPLKDYTLDTVQSDYVDAFYARVPDDFQCAKPGVVRQTGDAANFILVSAPTIGFIDAMLAMAFATLDVSIGEVNSVEEFETRADMEAFNLALRDDYRRYAGAFSAMVDGKFESSIVSSKVGQIQGLEKFETALRRWLIAFVLAHEVAHMQLDHAPIRVQDTTVGEVARSWQQEIAADISAAESLQRIARADPRFANPQDRAAALLAGRMYLSFWEVFERARDARETGAVFARNAWAWDTVTSGAEAGAELISSDCFPSRDGDRTICSSVTQFNQSANTPETRQESEFMAALEPLNRTLLEHDGPSADDPAIGLRSTHPVIRSRINRSFVDFHQSIALAQPDDATKHYLLLGLILIDQMRYVGSGVQEHLSRQAVDRIISDTAYEVDGAG
ncbi:MAG: hypothetical protein A4S12_07750 [Proteobacteria bacterium SG_bin5]|nr:hypothetical protein [Sphingomonas sp.]OQW41761.1 MAG: hypothetical protein A4S12_07750 [Proteobacteria bacterium SG_bin5]